MEISNRKNSKEHHILSKMISSPKQTTKKILQTFIAILPCNKNAQTDQTPHFYPNKAILFPNDS